MLDEARCVGAGTNGGALTVSAGTDLGDQTSSPPGGGGDAEGHAYALALPVSPLDAMEKVKAKFARGW